MIYGYKALTVQQRTMAFFWRSDWSMHRLRIHIGVGVLIWRLQGGLGG